jgi:hypothetical protein
MYTPLHNALIALSCKATALVHGNFFPHYEQARRAHYLALDAASTANATPSAHAPGVVTASAMAVDLAELVDAEQPEELQEPGPDEDAYLQVVSLYQLHWSCLFGQLQSTQCLQYHIAGVGHQSATTRTSVMQTLPDCSNYRCSLQRTPAVLRRAGQAA